MEEMTNKQIFWLSLTAILMIGVGFISNAWVNTPTNFEFNINMDNNTKDSINNISYLQNKIAELEFKKFKLENNLTLE